MEINQLITEQLKSRDSKQVSSLLLFLIFKEGFELELTNHSKKIRMNVIKNLIFDFKELKSAEKQGMTPQYWLKRRVITSRYARDLSNLATKNRITTKDNHYD